MRKFLAGLLVLVAAVYLWNASWLAPAPENPRIRLIAHRGVHQTFDREGIDNDTCTAERIFPPTHDFIENTIPSMRAAFQAGADVVELDVHPTPDGKFAVMAPEAREALAGLLRELNLAVERKLLAG